jgi:hypothetical protein
MGMKQVLFLFLGLSICVGIFAQQTGPGQTDGRKVDADVPQFIIDELENVPQDALVGIGCARMANMRMSMDLATARAKTAIARQINQVFFQMVRNYSVASGTEPDAVQLFQERITVTISKAELLGLSVVTRDMDDEGNFWVMVMMNKESVSNMITQAQDQAKADFPQMASFNTVAMLSNAIANVVKGEIAVVKQ